MRKLKDYIYKKLAVIVFRTSNTAYYKKLQSESHLYNFKNLGKNCKFHPQTYILNPQYITIGDDFRALWNLRIEACEDYRGQKFQPKIIIGNNVAMNSDVHIGCIDKVQIGDNCLLASRIFISDHDHGDTSYEDALIHPHKRNLKSKGPVIIGDNCWIGEGVAILSGVTVGKNSIIATNSVVTSDVPEFCVAVGIPAKVIKEIKQS